MAFVDGRSESTHGIREGRQSEEKHKILPAFNGLPSCIITSPLCGKPELRVTTDGREERYTVLKRFEQARPFGQTVLYELEDEDGYEFFAKERLSTASVTQDDIDIVRKEARLSVVVGLATTETIYKHGDNGILQIQRRLGKENLNHFYANKYQQFTLDLYACEHFFAQILNEVKIVHSKQVNHFDIKPGNFVLKRETGGSIRIHLIDFENASDKQETLYSEARATRLYEAPECLVEGQRNFDADTERVRETDEKRNWRSYTRPSDAFAVGVVLLQLWAGQMYPDYEATASIITNKKTGKTVAALKAEKSDININIKAINTLFKNAYRALQGGPADEQYKTLFIQPMIQGGLIRLAINNADLEERLQNFFYGLLNPNPDERYTINIALTALNTLFRDPSSSVEEKLKETLSTTPLLKTEGITGQYDGPLERGPYTPPSQAGCCPIWSCRRAVEAHPVDTHFIPRSTSPPLAATPRI